ncbi:UV DNA damage repair endonuclease UvsE [Sutcliffiella horikoshii]|uniref:UV DNA damage repair endonuclease UvsE n=1 Tax=Sutcliffiella horikoshii TaxID=79883 RepID=A0A5D4SIC2_9BACI|nr:UV DNA damage repair endonuclease UvsE [Sutcliffiella horikoshii]TYS63437.1 UV DNA damage repair endonuclease UvsE [Sutcliffiella horikoshii]
MTIVKLGYVAMSVQLTNASPSKTMTYAQFSKIKDREAAIEKLERISIENLENCLRLLKHNVANDIRFFRFSSKLIPLANHEEVKDWKFMRPLKEILSEIGDYIDENPMRVDFHPDHFVLLNSKNKDIINQTIKTLSMHRSLLKGMRVPTQHRCVLHIGGGYDDRELALEQFIHNFALVPQPIQEMLILENDDTTFHLRDALYVCEKLNVPLVFDYHHHLAHFEEKAEGWENEWGRVVQTWEHSPLPVKMHISSPRDEKNFRAHADYVDPKMFMDFLQPIKGSVPEIHCMIEAKKKDEALFQLMEEMKNYAEIEIIDGASFRIK